ncbi:esterase [Xylophilus sp.]|uniref:esterase n=1 Tax=Xylophilus sp. TaxID=2653893 RepID=UPI0013BBD1D1|nr:esterase [Xylophilus sp.]KAF1049367.1 MAG: hypothetical protein GAK38_00823 [Xylophilus sp.]
MARIVVWDEAIGGWPALHAAPLDRHGTPLPTVVVYHRFTQSKEVDSNIAVMLAQAGLRAVLPEADRHGARFDGDAASRIGGFWETLRSSIDELPALRDDLQARGWVDGDRVAVAGLSIGGFVALGCLARYEWLRAGVSWMGSAYFTDLARTLYPPCGSYSDSTRAAHDARMDAIAAYDPSTKLEQLASRPLMVWHGVRDDVVSFSEAARLHADMTRRGLARNLELVADTNAGHRLGHAGAQAGVDFLKSALAA